jgi:L-asparaginase / beta-aspartyl-peptidase
MNLIKLLAVSGVILMLHACHYSPKSTADAFENRNNNYCIVIHGGAGTILKKNMSDSLEAAYAKVLDEAVTKGYTVLKNGGSSMEAVTQTIMIMENSPLFNAGKGAVFTNEGMNELDASLMEGKTKKAGAVASVTRVKNPITLARAIMEQSEHVMMVGHGAEKFAEQKGIELVDPSYFYTTNRLKGLQKAREKEKLESGTNKTGLIYNENTKDEKFGTVGCVALDKNGNIAAGTSTGGMTNKRYGRVGDSPIIGAGTYADNNTCGVSATGWGEFFIRGVVAYDISAMMQYGKSSLEQAARKVIQQKVPEMGGDGGVIAIDRNGNIVMEFNTAGMFRAAIDTKGKKTIAMFK